MLPRVASLLLLAGLATPSSVTAQADPIPTTTYALTNARIVVAPGEVIDNGVVLIEEGRISGVGADLTAPPDVVPLDLSGMTVYAGMVDPASSLGLPAAQPQRGFGRGGGPSGASDGPPAALRPYQLASEVFDAEPDERDEVRRAGFTTLGLAFRGGLFPGKVAAISLGEGDGEALALRAPIALQVGTGRVPGQYPTTLMGALAYIEQSWEDTKYDLRVRAAFEQDPTSAPRPRVDREHRALEDAVTGALPVWFEASAERDFARMQRLADRLGVTDYVLVGGEEGYRDVERLASSGVPVIVSLDYPNPDQVTGRAFEYHIEPISGEDVEDERADSAVAAQLHGNAATLLDAGVTVALSPLGLDADDFRDHVRAAMAAGLSEEEALRAVTVTPAMLLGIDAAVGTVEEGKLANLIVTDGDLFAEGTSVVHAFVEGRRYDYDPVDEEENQGRRGGRGGSR